MGRPRLSPEERARREAERRQRFWSGATHKRYNPLEDGFGDPSQWERIAEELYGTTTPRFASGDEYLDALGLTRMPAALSDLKKAFRQAMMQAHPDRGGSNEEARRVLEAFAVLKRRFPNA